MSESVDIEIIVNGEKKTVAQGLSLKALVDEMGLGKHAVAVERNRDVVPRNKHEGTVLAAGDVLEIVTLVGGG